MRKLLATQVKMPRLLSGALCTIPVIMFVFITFMLVKLNSPTRTRIVYPLPANKSVVFKVPGHEYQLRTSKSAKGMGAISNLRWADTRRDGNGNVLLAVYCHDSKMGNEPKMLAAFDGTASGSRFYWSRDGSLFVVFIGRLPRYAYDFQEHKTLAVSSVDLPLIPTTETRRIETLVAKRGGRAEASFSQARWISSAEFGQFPKWY